MSDIKKDVQRQFGAAAASYVTSPVHARGESLAVLLEFAPPRAGWRVLDIATGGGHTALAFAPFVAEVVAVDLTPEMVEAATGLATQRGLTNVSARTADAEALPFDDGQFDLVTCRLAMHHFPNPHQALAEMARVARPDGGLVALTDNIVPPHKEDAGYINALEKVRDPSHNWCYPLPRLVAMFEKAGLKVENQRELTKEFDFDPWVTRQNVPPENQARLKKMLFEAPPGVSEYMSPRREGEKVYFTLHEAVILGRRAG